MNETPLQMPDLSQLPDPTKDIFGGMTSPTALMSLNNKQTNDLLNPPKVDTPLVKLSDEATRALQTAKETQDAINKNAMAMQQDLEQQYAQQAKEAKKRLEANKKDQGGKLGAGIDGSFVLKSKAEELVKKSEWQGIVSDAQRKDLMDDWLNKAKSELQRAGVTDETILANELSVAKNVINGDIQTYTNKMKSDHIDPLDLVSSLGKAARSMYRGAGILFGSADDWVSNKTGLPRITSDKSIAKWASEEKQAIDSINATYSDTMLLDQANYQYLRSKSKKNNPDEGVVGGFIQGAKDIWNSDNVISSIVDTVGYVPYAVVGTTAVSGVLGTAGAATGASSAISGILARSGAAGSKILGNVLSADAAGAAATSGILAATDAAGGAYDSVMDLNFKDSKVLENVKNNYTKSYGAANWESLLAESGGDITAVKEKLAIQAARVAGGTAFVTTAPLGMFGLEASIAKISSQGAAAQAGKRMLTVGANTVSETLEEGLTQYSQNVGEHPVTGVSLTDDVGANAAIGAVASAGMATTTQGLSQAFEKHGNTVLANNKPTFDSSSLNTDKWAGAGNINYDSYKQVIGHQFDNIARDARKIKLTEDDVQQLQQEAFNSYIDNKDIWARLTPEQTTQLKDYLSLSFNVNSNPYAKYSETPEVRAWNSNSAEQISSTILADNSNRDLLQAYRVKNNVDLDQVPESSREYYKTLASVLDTMQEYPTNVNTREREAQFQQVRADKVVDNQNLTDLQKRGITMFMRNFTDAGSRRMTMEQVKAYNEAKLTGAQGGSYEQRVTTPRQGQAGENAGTVPQESPSIGASSGQEVLSTSQGLEETIPAGTRRFDAESFGNNSSREIYTQSTAANDTTRNSPDLIGTGNGSGTPPQARVPQNTATATDAGRTTTESGIVGQTAESGEPIRQTRSISTPTPASSGVAGTSSTERYTNGGSEQTTSSQIPSISAPAIVPNISLDAARDAFSKLTNAQRKEIRRVSNGEDPVNTLHSILAGNQADLTKVINTTTQNKVVANKIQNAVTAARDHIFSSEKLLADLNSEQLRNTANKELIEPIANAIDLSTAKISLLASLASNMYLEKAKSLEEKKTLAAKLLADFAGIPVDLTYTLLVGKLEGSNKKPTSNAVKLINDTIAYLKHTVIPDNVESRPKPLQIQDNLFGITTILSTVDTATHNILKDVTKRIVGRVGDNNIAILLQSLLQMKLSGVDVSSYIQKRTNNVKKAAAVDSVIRQAEGYTKLDNFARIKRADLWLQTVEPSAYVETVSNIVTSMLNNKNSLLNKYKKNVLSTAANVTGGIVTNTAGVDIPAVSDFIANIISDSSKLGNQYLTAILKTRGGINNNGGNKVSTLAADNVAKVVNAVRYSLLDTYAADNITSNTNTTITSNERIENASPELNTSETGVTGTTGNLNTGFVSIPNLRDENSRGTSYSQDESQYGGRETEISTPISDQQGELIPYSNRLTSTEKTSLDAMAKDYGVSTDSLLHALVNNDDSIIGTPIKREVSLYLYDTTNKVSEVDNLVSRLTEPPVDNGIVVSGDLKVADFFIDNPADLASINDYLASERNRLNAIIDSSLDEQVSSLSGIDEDTIQNSRDAAIKELRDLPKDANELVAQHIVDDELFSAETPKTNLPQKIKDIINRVLQRIGKTVAGVSMMIALATGINISIPNDAMAASSFERSTVSRIVSTADNNGKPIIVADKTKGTLTIYDGAGNEITSTPALFGKTIGDDMQTKNTTPSGRFELTETSTVNKATYGNSAQALTRGGVMQTNNAGNLAIHRVVTSFKSENRVGRLNSASASDNRISHGCINVPADFYDNYLNGKSDAVVYILPETESGKTGVFAGKEDVKSTSIVVDGTPVDPKMDMANVESIPVNPTQLSTATPPSNITTAPVKAMQPLILAGTEPSGQVAFTAPVVLGGVTSDQVYVPKSVYTPAEIRIDGIFDTQPISAKETTDEGHSIYDLAVLLAGLGVGAKVLTSRKRKFLSSKKERLDNDTQTRTEIAQEEVDTNHNAAVNPRADHIIKNAEAPIQKTVMADAISRAMWMEYIQNSHLTMQKDTNGNMVEGGQVLSAFVDTMSGFEWAIDDALSDKTYEEATSGVFSDPLRWNNKITDTTRSGISAKVMNFAAGITQTFDNLMTQQGIARVGYERDSSIPSKHLAAVKAKASGAYSQLHKIYIKPLVHATTVLASSLRRSYEEVESDVGQVATVKHVLNEAADAMWNGRERIIAAKKEQLAAVDASIAASPADAAIRLSLTNVAQELTKDIRNLTDELQKARDMYYGVVEWDGKVGMPGGYTKAAAETVLSEIANKYGADFNKIEHNVSELVHTIKGIRNFAAASGVFSNGDLQTFRDLGFTEYVPLYKQHKDPRVVDESSMATRTSLLDNVLASIPTSQVRAMGLNKDLSRYHREGATTPAADAYTNMKVFANNLAGRIGSVGWVNSVQQLYEGTVGKPISATQLTDEAYLKEINNSYDSGKLPGLIRVHPGAEQYLPENTRSLIRDIQPIYGKGYNTYGEQVPYNYYFTEPAIQAEVYANTDLHQTLSSQLVRNVGSVTRLAARMITTFKPVWNVYNFMRDSLDRIGIVLMRPVKNNEGKTIGKMDLAKSYFRNLAQLTGSLSAQKEIYRYLTLGETNTKIQKVMHEAVGEGAINLMTSQTEKNSITADYRKSTIDKITSELGSKLGAGLNKLGAGALKYKSEELVDFYVMRMTEVPQIITALASYLSYKELGVNKAETANRVRDQYDPTRASGTLLNSMSQAFPFVRSTFSGHYNLARSLTEYWTPNQWQWTLAFNLGSVIIGLGVMAMASSMFGDDDDGTPKIARLPIGTLMSGIPIPVGDTGVWSLPVGFGHSKVLWGISASLYKYLNGQQSGSELAQSLLGIVVDNTSPLQTASGNTFQENPTIGMLLTITPLLAIPLMELATNTKSFGGSRIVGRETPRDQLASEQDTFNTPETYKKWAKWLYSVGLGDHRPEEIRHLFESYMWGPLGAIPKSVIQDVSDKSLGNTRRKGEVFGPLLTAIGADMSIQTNALDLSNQTQALNDLRMKLHKKYGVGETHSADDYSNYGITGREDRALRLTEAKLRERNVPEDAVQFILNGMRYDKTRQQMLSDCQKAAAKYYALRQEGKDDPILRTEVQDMYDSINELTKAYIRENNHVYFELLRQ